MSLRRQRRQGRPQGRIETRATRADGIVSSLNPRHWYRADTYTLSGANLATLQNRNATVGGHLAVAAGTISAPSVGVVLGGAPKLELNGTQRLQASHAASEFTFLNGSAFDAVMVLRSPHTTTGILWTTVAGSGEAGTQVYTLATSGNRGLVSRGTGGTPTLVSVESAPFSGPNTDIYLEWSIASSLSPQWFQSDKAQTLASGVLAGTPAPGAPTRTLSVGGYLGNTALATVTFADLLLFDRRLTTYERQLVREYIQTRYGIAAE